MRELWLLLEHIAEIPVPHPTGETGNISDLKDGWKLFLQTNILTECLLFAGNCSKC